MKLNKLIKLCVVTFASAFAHSFGEKLVEKIIIPMIKKSREKRVKDKYICPYCDDEPEEHDEEKQDEEEEDVLDRD